MSQGLVSANRQGFAYTISGAGGEKSSKIQSLSHNQKITTGSTYGEVLCVGGSRSSLERLNGFQSHKLRSNILDGNCFFISSGYQIVEWGCAVFDGKMITHR